MKNVHLACSEAFDVQLKNSGSSRLVGNVPYKEQFYPDIAPLKKRRFPICRPSLNIGMGIHFDRFGLCLSCLRAVTDVLTTRSEAFETSIFLTVVEKHGVY